MGIAIGYPVLNQTPEDNIFLQLLLLNAPSFNLIAWTLVYEIYFYVWVGLVVLLSMRRPDIGMLVLIVLIPSLVYFQPLPAGRILHTKVMLEFVFGLIVGLLYARTSMDGRWTLGIGCIGIVIGLYFVSVGTEHINKVRTVTLALPSAFILHGLMAMEKSGVLKIREFLAAAGDRSYSVYLWHFPILYLPVHKLIPTGVMWNMFGIGMLIALTVVVSELSYRFIERPVITMGRRFSIGGRANTRQEA